MKTVTLQNNIVFSDFIVVFIVLHNCGKGKYLHFYQPKALVTSNCECYQHLREQNHWM